MRKGRAFLHRLVASLVATGVAALLTMAAPDARADLAIGAEAGPNFVVGDTAGKDGSTGFGFAGRLGYPLPIPLLKLTPELKVAYDTLPLVGGGGMGSITAGTLRGMAGARLTIGALLSPVAFAHVGYGHASGSEGTVDVSRGGLCFDAGVGLDFTLLPVIDLGVFGSYNRLKADEGDINWITLGAQVVITL